MKEREREEEEEEEENEKKRLRCGKRMRERLRNDGCWKKKIQG